MGCILSAASCNKWFCESILNTDDYNATQRDISKDDLGNNHVYFLPYLMGERSPINDTDARGMFLGMRADTKREDMVLSVLEGVAFAIRQNFEVAKSMGVEISRSTLCGGGARSELWCKILCNVLNIPLDLPKTEEGPGYGGAMLAMVGTGHYACVEDCAKALLSVQKTILPDPEIAARYEIQYRKFEKIYPTVKSLFYN
jgi:xylulokinase